MDNESKKLLEDLFSILELSDDKKEASFLMFKKKVAEEIMNRIKKDLPREYRDFIEKEGARITSPDHPMIKPIREELKKLHTDEEYKIMAHGILKDLLPEYVNRVSRMSISADKIARLEERIKNFS